MEATISELNDKIEKLQAEVEELRTRLDATAEPSTTSTLETVTTTVTASSTTNPG